MAINNRITKLLVVKSWLTEFWFIASHKWSLIWIQATVICLSCVSALRNTQILITKSKRVSKLHFCKYSGHFAKRCYFFVEKICIQMSLKRPQYRNNETWFGQNYFCSMKFEVLQCKKNYDLKSYFKIWPHRLGLSGFALEGF